MKTADAFYLKQIAYTFIVPAVVTICLVGWYCVWVCCAERKGYKKIQIKDYLILTIVLMLFLCYPMLVRLCLSMLQCPYINDTHYLMADLEEPCFVGRHVDYVLLLTVPQIILYVIGLPAISAYILLGQDQRKIWTSYSFRMRFGLLYMGYRKERYWWELIIVIRKLAIVMIGIFGSLMGRVDLQAYVALLVIFFSIVVHLVGKPFDTHQQHTNLLYILEFLGLSVCWGSFWAGLIFFLGPSVIKPEAVVVMTGVIWVTNVGYLFFAIKCYVIEFIKDRRKKRETKKKQTMSKEEFAKIIKSNKILQKLSKLRVHPVNSLKLIDVGSDDESEKKEDVLSASDGVNIVNVGEELQYQALHLPSTNEQ